MKRGLKISLLVSAFFVLAHVEAHAQAANALDSVVTTFRTQASGWQNALTAFAKNTFMILAGVEITVAAIKLAFKNCDASEWLAEIVNQILSLGFFLALLENSVTWGTAIVNSFRQAAGTAGATGMAPSDVFACGIRIATEVMNQMTILHPAASAAFMIAGIVIEVCFALMAALMVLTLVESYLVISMSVIFMAFGGSAWTRETAISALRYCVSVGAKLFVIQLLVSVGSGIMTGWANGFTKVTDSTLCVIIGSSIVMLAIIKTLPDTIQAMINGSSMSSTSAMTGAAMQLAAGANAVASAAASTALRACPEITESVSAL